MRVFILAFLFSLPIYVLGLGTPLSLARLIGVSGGSPPAAPSMLVVSSVDASGVTLGWQDNSSDETGIWIQYNQFDGGWFSVSTGASDPNPTPPNAVSFFAGVDEFPDNSQIALSYTKFRIYATNDFGSSAYSAEVQVPPSVVVSDLDGLVNLLDVELSWTPTGENGDTEIYRSTDSGMSYSLLTTLPGGGDAYTDSGVIMSFSAAVLRYKIRYVNSGGNGPYSNITTPHL